MMTKKPTMLTYNQKTGTLVYTNITCMVRSVAASKAKEIIDLLPKKLTKAKTYSVMIGKTEYRVSLA